MAKRIPESGALKEEAKPQQKPRDASSDWVRGAWRLAGGSAAVRRIFVPPAKREEKDGSDVAGYKGGGYEGPGVFLCVRSLLESAPFPASLGSDDWDS